MKMRILYMATILLLLLAGALPLSSGAFAQTPAIDTDQPIRINADSLEVKQQQQLAVFSGNVEAVQGNIVLRADTLRVHYKADKNGGGNTISRLDALGNVFIASPAETAQGQRGVYDVTARVITLEGGVVLTRGDNVLRGSRLVLNLATGVSKLEGSVSGSAMQGTTRRGGRVQGIFVPEKKKK